MESHDSWSYPPSCLPSIWNQPTTYTHSTESSAQGFAVPNPEPTWSCLQDVLRDIAKSSQSGHLIFYNLGNISNPMSISYASLYTQAKGNIIKIRSLSRFQEGRPILLHFDDHLDTIVWFWSVLLANGIPVLSSTLSNVDDQRHYHLAGLSSMLESPICITKTSFLHLFDGGHTLHLETIERMQEMDLQSNADTTHPIYQGGQCLAILMLTSGSTGNVKAVRLSHKQILSAVFGKASVRNLPPGRPFLNWIGLDHVASLVEIHIQAMWFGVSQVHAHAADIVSSPLTFLDLLDRHHISRSFAPHFFLAKLLLALQSTQVQMKWNLSNLTVLASGGEANDVETCITISALFEKYGARRDVITPGFGMTETCAGAIFNLDCPRYDIENNRTMASLGTSMKGIKMRVMVNRLESNERQAFFNEPGDLEVRGEVVFEGYYRDPTANAQCFTSDGWFRTGDQAVIDGSGSLSLIGRVKDVVNINGVKLPSADIQTSLHQVVGGRVARLISFPSRAAHSEQITVAYIPIGWPMQHNEMLEIEDLIIQACMLSVISRPLVFSLREESVPLLPTTSLGKISRAKMRSLYEAGVFSADVDLHFRKIQELKCSGLQLVDYNPMSEAEARFINDFSMTLNINPVNIGVHTSIFELGFSSMNLIRLKHSIDYNLGTTVPLITIMKNPTARSLATALGTSEYLPTTGLPGPETPTTAKYDPVVCFRSSGSKAPLWLVHPGVGEVLVFVGLAQHLAADDRPVYALRARGLELGQTRFSSIGETVETYVDAIRQRQPRGPFALAGYSYGTMLAFEIAKRLTASDGSGTVQFLGSFNLPPHIKSRMRQLNWNICLLHLAYFLDLMTEAYAECVEEQGFHTIPREKALAQVLGAANEGRVNELGLDRSVLGRWVDVAYGLQSMAAEYDPAGMVDVIDVFHATPLKVAAASRDEWLREHLSKWRDFCRTVPRFHEVGGAHYTMLGPNHVKGFSVELQSALKARGL